MNTLLRASFDFCVNCGRCNVGTDLPERFLVVEVFESVVCGNRAGGIDQLLLSKRADLKLV